VGDYSDMVLVRARKIKYLRGSPLVHWTFFLVMENVAIPGQTCRIEQMQRQKNDVSQMVTPGVFPVVNLNFCPDNNNGGIIPVYYPGTFDKVLAYSWHVRSLYL